MLKRCFDDLTISNLKFNSNYSSNWYDVDGDQGEVNHFHFYVPERDGAIYLNFESYGRNLVPMGEMCFGSELVSYSVDVIRVFRGPDAKNHWTRLFQRSFMVDYEQFTLPIF